VLLTDFGIAKGLDVGDDDLTSDNVMMGTAKYLSPEQVRGRRLDGRADLYSLGLVLYECLAGRVPFLGESDADTALARLQRDPTDLGHLRPTLPIGLVNLIHRTLARNPAHRPQNGSDLRSALLAVDTTPPVIDGTPAEPPPRIKNPPTKALGAGPGVPGDPHVSMIPARADSTPPGEPVRDHTPVAPDPIRGAPARQHEQRWTPSLVGLGGLLALALVFGVVLFVNANRGEEPDGVVEVTTASEGEAEQSAAPGSAVAVQSSAPAVEAGVGEIVGVQAWDPDGDNGSENDAQAELALADDVDSTNWATECYQNQFMGAKRGVGLILEFDGAATGTVAVETLNAPYQLEFYAVAGGAVPADLDGWTPIGTKQFGDQPAMIETRVDTAATHVLVWIKELGRDDACTGTNPFRGRLGEISFRP